MIELKIQGEPIAMERPRLGRASTYNPQKKLKERVQWELKTLWPFDPLVRPLVLRFTFLLTRDNKDLDNMVKFYLDAMQGIVFKNDIQVWSFSATKGGSNAGQTRIEVE